MLEAAPKKVWKMDEREKQKRSAAHSDVGQNQEQKRQNRKKKRQKETGRSAWQHTLSGSATTDLKRLGECFSEVHTKCIGDSGESQAGGGPVIESTATAMWGRTKPTKKIGQKRTEKKKRNLESICSLPRPRSSVRKCTPKKKKKSEKKNKGKGKSTQPRPRCTPPSHDQHTHLALTNRSHKPS